LFDKSTCLAAVVGAAIGGVSSPPKVIESAEQIERKIADTYLTPDKTFLELREMINSQSVDLLREFSVVCRAELEALRAQQF
jgi:hypothetical protein